MIRPTPGKPGQYLQKNDEDGFNIDEYRSLVGQIIFLRLNYVQKWATHVVRSLV